MRREGSIQKAIRAYQKAIDLNAEAVGAYINLGTIYYNLGKLDAPESCYRAALSIDPGYVLAHLNLGNVADVLRRRGSHGMFCMLWARSGKNSRH